MFTIILIIIIALLVLIVAFLLAKSKVGGKVNYTFTRKGTLLSKPEQILFHRLIEAFPNHLIFAQVALTMVVKPVYFNRSEGTIFLN